MLWNLKRKSLKTEKRTFRKMRDYGAGCRLRILVHFLSIMLAFSFFIPVFAAGTDDVVFTGAIALNELDEIAGYNEETGEIEGDDAIRDVIAIDFANSGSASFAGVDLSSLTAEDGIISKINDTCQGIAVALAIAMFCVSWMQAYLNGTATDEIWLQKFVIFGLSLAGIFLARQLTLYVATIGSGVAEMVTESGSAAGNVEKVKSLREAVAEQLTPVKHNGLPVIENLQDMGSQLTAIGKGVVYMGAFALPWLVTWVTRASLYITCWGRAIEVLILAALSPFGFVGIDRGMDAPIRFIKQIFVLGIQGAIIMTVVVLCRNLSMAALATIFDNATAEGLTKFSAFWSVIVINLVELGMLSRSRSIAQTLVN